MTTLISGNEIALPGFIMATDGIDFKTDATRPAIAEGGGGVIRHCQFQNYGIGAAHVKADRANAVVKTVKGTSQAVFKQEVGLMFYFRDEPCIIKLLAFNLSEMQIVMSYFELGPMSSVLTSAETELTWNFGVVL